MEKKKGGKKGGSGEGRERKDFMTCAPRKGAPLTITLEKRKGRRRETTTHTTTKWRSIPLEKGGGGSEGEDVGTFHDRLTIAATG